MVWQIMKPLEVYLEYQSTVMPAELVTTQPPIVVEIINRRGKIVCAKTLNYTVDENKSLKTKLTQLIFRKLKMIRMLIDDENVLKKISIRNNLNGNELTNKFIVSVARNISPTI